MGIKVPKSRKSLVNWTNWSPVSKCTSAYIALLHFSVWLTPRHTGHISNLHGVHHKDLSSPPVCLTLEYSSHICASDVISVEIILGHDHSSLYCIFFLSLKLLEIILHIFCSPSELLSYFFMANHNHYNVRLVLLIMQTS